MMHFGKWLLAESAIYIFIQRLDMLFLTRFADYRELGIYSAAVKMAMLASIITSSATTIFMPRGCGCLESKAKLKHYFKESFVITSLLMGSILVLMAGAPLCIKVFFGAAYSQCLTATRILLLDAIFVLLYTPFSFLFYARGDTKQIFKFGLVKLAVTVGVLLALVPGYGSIGAAASIASASCIGLLYAAVASLKIIRDPHKYCKTVEVANA
jgi:O-antigen/teichoic acid export membrane protein